MPPRGVKRSWHLRTFPPGSSEETGRKEERGRRERERKENEGGRDIGKRKKERGGERGRGERGEDEEGEDSTHWRNKGDKEMQTSPSHRIFSLIFTQQECVCVCVCGDEHVCSVMIRLPQ